MQEPGLEKKKSKLPAALLERIARLEDRIVRGELGDIAEKIAVFDMDNTLLIGDIGDAVFAWMLLEKRPLAFTWQEYTGLIRSGKKGEAFERVVTAMAGISVEDLLETTRRVLYCGLPYLELGEVKVPVPKAHPLMQVLLELLKSLGYQLYVISATNQFSAHVTMQEFFGMEASRVFGIKPRLVYDEQSPGEVSTAVLASELEEPITVAEGKAELYKKLIGTNPPILSAGNSESDIPLLNLTHSRGIIIWMGKDAEKFESVKEKIIHPASLFFINQQRQKGRQI